MTLIVLIDDTRTFRAPVPHLRGYNSRDGLELLARLRDQPGGDLWLDHDLGEVDGRLDTIMPVVDELAAAAFHGRPYPVARIYVHTSNPSGAAAMLQVLRRWDYPVRQVAAGDHLIQEPQDDPGRDVPSEP